MADHPSFDTKLTLLFLSVSCSFLPIPKHLLFDNFSFYLAIFCLLIWGGKSLQLEKISQDKKQSPANTEL